LENTVTNTSDKQLRVALVGLGFGQEFAPIYLHHPNVSGLVICDGNRDVLDSVGDKFGITDRRADLSAILSDESIDAVHLVTPIPLHAEQTVAVLRAGKHCACTVPMACSLADLTSILNAQRSSGKKYMMMETAVYTREFLYAQHLVQSGALGRIQLLRGAHYQDMENWPSYWMGLPPMHYATHAVSPLLALTQTRCTEVHCYGSGVMRPELHQQYGNPYPIETAIFRLAGTEAAAEVTRSLFHSAHAYTESFNVYGEDICFEWQQIESEEPVLFEIEPLRPGRGRATSVRRVSCPDRADLLPPQIARFARAGVYDESTPHLSFTQGGGHGGSHPHLVHEFVSSIVENRTPAIDAVTAAHWTAAGICAHDSAMRGGERVEVPDFSLVV
jgi:predicted dehydrogenase